MNAFEPIVKDEQNQKPVTALGYPAWAGLRNFDKLKFIGSHN